MTFRLGVILKEWVQHIIITHKGDFNTIFHTTITQQVFTMQQKETSRCSVWSPVSYRDRHGFDPRLRHDIY